MQVRTINLDEDSTPTSVTVDMTIREVALITRMIGHTTHTDRQQYQNDGGTVGSNIWNVLSGDILNRFWDDGIDAVP